jgi:hypothetical protein
MANKPTPSNNQDLGFVPEQELSFNEAAFDDFIHSQGIELLHYRATRCPVGLIDQDDMSRRPHEDHEGCSNGFIYTEAGVITSLFQNNGKDARMVDLGRMDSSTVQVTFPRFYDTVDDAQTPVLVSPFDRFYIKEDAGLEVVNWQLHQAHASGLDRLNFEVKKVIDLIDSRGHRYYVGTDFEIHKGLIKWKDNSGPGTDPQNNKGVVYSVRYTYRPYYYLSKMIHETRVVQIQDDMTGERHVERMPQTALLQREYNFLSEGSEEKKDAASARAQRVPASGSFGPR